MAHRVAKHIAISFWQLKRCNQAVAECFSKLGMGIRMIHHRLELRRGVAIIVLNELFCRHHQLIELIQRRLHSHTVPYSAALAALMKASTFALSFTPGRASTPDDTSTAAAPDLRIASATFSGVSPPESVQSS